MTARRRYSTRIFRRLWPCRRDSGPEKQYAIILALAENWTMSRTAVLVTLLTMHECEGKK